LQDGPDPSDRRARHPLDADTRRRFEQQLAKEADFGRRKAQLREAQNEPSKARESIGEQVAAELKAERSAIARAEVRSQKPEPNTSLLNWAPASSLFMLSIKFRSGSVKPPEDSASAGNVRKLARYLSMAAALPT
jgi:hypothetical protein